MSDDDHGTGLPDDDGNEEALQSMREEGLSSAKFQPSCCGENEQQRNYLDRTASPDRHPPKPFHSEDVQLPLSLKITQYERDLYHEALSSVVEAMRILTSKLLRDGSHDEGGETKSDNNDANIKDDRLWHLQNDLIGAAEETTVTSNAAERDDLDLQDHDSNPLLDCAAALQSLDSACSITRDHLRLAARQHEDTLEDLFQYRRRSDKHKEQNSALKQVSCELKVANDDLTREFLVAQEQRNVLAKEVRKLRKQCSKAETENDVLRKENHRRHLLLSLEMHERELKFANRIVNCNNSREEKKHDAGVIIDTGEEAPRAPPSSEGAGLSATPNPAEKRKKRAEIGFVYNTPTRGGKVVENKKVPPSGSNHESTSSSLPQSQATNVDPVDNGVESEDDGSLPHLPPLDMRPDGKSLDVDMSNEGSAETDEEDVTRIEDTAPFQDDDEEHMRGERSKVGTVHRIIFSSRGKLGITVERTPEGMCIVERVQPSAQAYLAGMRDGDVVCLPGPGEDAESAHAMQYDHFIALIRSGRRPLRVKVWRRRRDIRGSGNVAEGRVEISETSNMSHSTGLRKQREGSSVCGGEAAGGIGGDGDDGVGGSSPDSPTSVVALWKDEDVVSPATRMWRKRFGQRHGFQRP